LEQRLTFSERTRTVSDCFLPGRLSIILPHDQHNLPPPVGSLAQLS